MHLYEVRPRNDHRGVDLISDALTRVCDSLPPHTEHLYQDAFLLGISDYSRTKCLPCHVAVKLYVCPFSAITVFVGLAKRVGPLTLTDMTCCPGDKVPL